MVFNLYLSEEFGDNFWILYPSKLHEECNVYEFEIECMKGTCIKMSLHDFSCKQNTGEGKCGKLLASFFCRGGWCLCFDVDLDLPGCRSGFYRNIMWSS